MHQSARPLVSRLPPSARFEPIRAIVYCKTAMVCNTRVHLNQSECWISQNAPINAAACSETPIVCKIVHLNQSEHWISQNAPISAPACSDTPTVCKYEPIRALDFSECTNQRARWLRHAHRLQYKSLFALIRALDHSETAIVCNTRVYLHESARPFAPRLPPSARLEQSQHWISQNAPISGPACSETAMVCNTRIYLHVSERPFTLKLPSSAIQEFI